MTRELRAVLDQKVTDAVSFRQPSFLRTPFSDCPRKCDAKERVTSEVRHPAVYGDGA